MPAAVTPAQTSKTVSEAALADPAQPTSSNIADGLATNIVKHSNQEDVPVTPKPQQRTAEEIAADHGRYLRQGQYEEAQAWGRWSNHEIPNQKRKTSISSNTSADAGEKKTIKAPVKKRKTSTSSNTDASAVERNDSLSPRSWSKIGDFNESKEIKRPAKKAPGQKRAAPAKDNKVPDVATQNKPELSVIVSSKLCQVQQYAAGIDQALGFWLRDRCGQVDPAMDSDLQQPIPSKVTVPESAVLGTLTRMLLDYELAVPISLDTVRDIIVQETFDAPAFVAAERAEGIRKNGVRWITLDLDRSCIVDDQLRGKVAGCGFEVRSWFEVELEMYERQLWRSAVPSKVEEAAGAGRLQENGEHMQGQWRAEI
ncbi:hypothetical protein EJ03DRAFT_375615 [Teratosphaeria nubilosa]|uniref:Uncharacterized protein n=1 Tax=Teratosphaeria nubilosa TaxID=161662 RepID=A0A6G1L6K3_9PEZI|nr:hypothetical protein EJ03DRAFT_375615 [Teratosphaeria nubilosa]